MAKRKYTKKNTAYWEELSKARKYSVSYEGSALQRYHQAQREAKEHGGAYKEYVEQYYKISRNLRSKKVRITSDPATGKAGVPNPEVLTYQQFERKSIVSNKNKYEIVRQQFGLISSNAARRLKATLEENGKRISLQRAQARQLTIDEWDILKAKYNDLVAAGLTSKAAKLEISQYFFGS